MYTLCWTVYTIKLYEYRGSTTPHINKASFIKRPAQMSYCLLYCTIK